MTFEDGIAYSRNVVAAKVALGARPDTAEPSAILHDDVDASSGSARRPASTSPARSAGLVNDPAITPWREIDLANGSFGQGVAVTPIQLATAYAAMVNGGTLVQPHVVKSIGGVARWRRRAAARSIDPALSTTLIRADGARRRRGPVLPRPDARSRAIDVGGKTGTAQIWDPTRATAGRLEAQHLQLLVRRLHRPRGGHPGPRRSRSGSRRARRRIARVGQLEMPVMSFELFRRIATDAITTPGPARRSVVRRQRTLGDDRTGERAPVRHWPP